MKKQKDILEKSWMFLIIIFIGISIFVYLFYDFFNKPEFTIYKEECRNETNQIGYSCGFSYKFNNLNDNMTINFTLKPEPPNYNFLLKAQEECRRIEQEAYINSMSLEYPNTLETWNNPIYETEQICERKEVDKIEYLGTENKSVEVCNCGFIICYSNGECGGQFAGIGGFDRETPVDKCYQKLEEIENENSKDNTIVSFSGLCNNNHFKDILIEVNKSISKKDITKDFLYENCGCINFSCSSDCETIYLSPDIFECQKNIKRFSDGGFEYTLCQKKCSEYKCFEDYFIEVN